MNEFIIDLLIITQKLYSTTFEHDEANILQNMQVSLFSHFETHQKQKVAIATSLDNEHFHCMQSDLQKCEIKLGKFHFTILWC